MSDNVYAAFVVGVMISAVTTFGMIVVPLFRETMPVVPTLTAAPPAQGAAITSAGVIVVGRDVEAGKYQTYAPRGCHWRVLETTTGEADSGYRVREDSGAIAARLWAGQALVTVGCGNWVEL